MKHILAVLVLGLIINLSHAAKPQPQVHRSGRCRDVSAVLHGASVLGR